MSKQPLDYVVVLDFEATCDDKNPPVPQEVIEFPSVLLSMDNLEVVDEFSTFVRPIHHPNLTEFCTELTGITQTDVDPAPTFSEVFVQHQEWLRSHGLPLSPEEDGPAYAIVLCGDWDFRTMLPEQCKACDPPIDYIPHPYRKWINIKRIYERWSRGKKASGMVGMLRALGLTLEGRHHRGIDDCRNIANMVRALAKAGLRFDITSQLSPSRYPPVTLQIQFKGETKELFLQKRAMGSLLGIASGLFQRQIVRVQLPNGMKVTDTNLLDLRNGDTLVALHKA